MKIATSEKGKRCGERHPAATLTDRDVELMRQLHEQGWGYRRLAAKFETPRATVQRLCTYRNR